MGNSSEIEKVFVKRVASWQRKVRYHSGSFWVVLPREFMRSNMIKKNSKCEVIFTYAIDEKTGRVLNLFEVVSE